MTKPSSRAPSMILALLREGLRRLEKGPDDKRIWCGESEDFKRGYRDAVAAHKRWARTWVTPDLRKVLAYLDGAETCHGIRCYGNGYNYEEPPES